MREYFLRVWNDLGARVSGPLSLRLFLQPTMATIFAIRDGMKDAKATRPPYFYSVFTDAEHRRSMLNEGWRAVAKVFTLPVNRIARSFAHKSVQGLSIAIICAICFAGVAEAQSNDTHSSPNPSPDKWEISVTPYIFLARLDGDVGVLGQTAQVNASFSDIFRNLDFAAMGTFEARKGNWSVLVDGMYMSLSGQKITPSPLFSDIDVKVKEIIVTPQVTYRVLKVERGNIDLLAGARIWHVKSHVTFQPRILPLVDVEGSRNWGDPIVGARGMATVSPRVFLLGEFDAGGFGIGSDFTGQVFGGAGFQLKPRVALIGGYRYLRVDYKNEGFIFETALSGITLGAKFRF